MKESNLDQIPIEYLSTAERRKYAEDLQKYTAYFQRVAQKAEGKTIVHRILEHLPKDKKKAEDDYKKIDKRVQGYHALLKKIVAKSVEECKKHSLAADHGSTDNDSGIATLSGAAATNATLSWLEGGALATGGGGMAAGTTGLTLAGPLSALLANMSTLSDKQRIAALEKIIETSVALLEKSNISEDKIKSALLQTMDTVSAIKEKYGDHADDEEVAKAIQDECVVEVAKFADSSADYAFFHEKIENSIGAPAWNKMTRNAQIFLVTAEISYEQWQIYGDNIDFAPICMSVSKALEVEVTRRYFLGFLEYEKKQRNHRLPDALVRRDKYGNEYDKGEEEFTLGDITGVTGYSMNPDTGSVYLVNRLLDENQGFLRYAKQELFQGKSEAQCVSIIKNHVRSIKKVCIEYRNPSAHKQKISKISARECLDYMIDVKRVIGEMLDDCVW